MIHYYTPLLLLILLVGCESPTTDSPAEVTTENPDSLILWYGKTKEAAIAQAEATHTLYRIAREDGKRFPMTRDLREGRVTFEIDKGIISYAVTEYRRGSRMEGVADLKLRPYMGLSEADAMALAKKNSVPCRVANRDGKPQALTMDHRPDRVNLSVISGVVVAARFG